LDGGQLSEETLCAKRRCDKRHAMKLVQLALSGLREEHEDIRIDQTTVAAREFTKLERRRRFRHSRVLLDLSLLLSSELNPSLAEGREERVVSALALRQSVVQPIRKRRNGHPGCKLYLLNAAVWSCGVHKEQASACNEIVGFCRV
jgi:hypothetical protein